MLHQRVLPLCFLLTSTLLAAAPPPELTVLRTQYEKILAERVSGPFDAALTELSAAKGFAFDRAFLNGMIKHHAGALKMVDDLFKSPGAGQEVDANVFANEVVTAQTGEIGIMRRLLTQLPPR